MRIFLAALFLALAASCSSVDVRTDHDPRANLADYHTYELVSPQKLSSLQFAMPRNNANLNQPVVRNPVLEVKLERIIDRDLKNSGFTPVEHGRPDFYVTYYTMTWDQIWVSDWGGGYYWDGGYWGWASPEVKRQASLILVFVDAKTKQPIWSGRASDGLFDDPSKDDKKIAEAVGKMLQDFHEQASERIT